MSYAVFGESSQVTLAVLTAVLISQAALAQETAATSSKESQLGLGLGAGVIRRPYLDVDDEAVVLPILLYENRWVSIAGPVADLKLASVKSISFRLRARYEPGVGYEADDSAALSGMEERKAGGWLGGAVLWQTGIVDVGAEWLGDVSGYSGGQRATLSLQRRFPLGRFSVAPHIEVIWLDGRNVNYYYGVRDQEALTDRSFYEADSAINMRLAIRADYVLMARHVLNLEVSATRLGDEIEDSPIVDRSVSSAVLLGYTYMF
jgi:outer membrane protein